MVRAVNAPLKRTALYDTHRALGARIVPFAGWELPIQYAGIVEEHRAVRERAGLFDVSHMGELRVRGAGAERMVDGLVTNDVGALSVGKALYTCCCNEEGTILDDLIVYRIAEGDVMIVCNASNLDKMRAHFAKESSPDAQFADESDATSLIALQGPKALDVMRAAGAEDALLALPRFGVARGRVGTHAVLVARTGYTGEDGFELFVPHATAPALWNALMDAGAPSGIAPVGLGARDTLRLEAALRLYGNDIDETTDPWEAGLGWTVKLEGRAFRGREALIARRAAGNARQLVGLEMVGRGTARHHYAVVSAAAGGHVIGHVTSGSPAPTLGKSVALAYVPRDRATIDTQLFIDVRGKYVEAKVVRLPFYRRPN